MKKVIQDPEWMDTIITVDETWVYCYDPKTKRNSSEWRGKNESRPKKPRLQKSRMKTLLTVFFDSKGIIFHKVLGYRETVNQHVYLIMLKGLKEAIRKKRPGLWVSKE